MGNNKTYKLKAKCVNCNWDGEIDVPKGLKLKDTYCPNCDCKDLVSIIEPKF